MSEDEGKLGQRTAIDLRVKKADTQNGAPDDGLKNEAVQVQKSAASSKVAPNVSDHVAQSSKFVGTAASVTDQNFTPHHDTEIIPPARDQNPSVTRQSKQIPIPEDHLDLILGPPKHLNSNDKKNFRDLSRDIRSDINPEDIIERFWARDICGFEMRLYQLRGIREQLVQNHYESCLTAILIEKTNDNVLAVFEDMRDGNEKARQTLDELKVKFAVTDEQVRFQVEIRFRDQIARIDAEMRSIEQARDRVIELIEKRRFVLSVNARMKKYGS